MRPFAEYLADAMGAGEPVSPAASSRARSLDDEVCAMLAAALAIEPERPAWARRLGVSYPCTREDLHRAFRRRAFETHPDRPGGSHDAFIAVTRALEEGLRALERGSRHRGE